jgi:hypothetical protein
MPKPASLKHILETYSSFSKDDEHPDRDLQARSSRTQDRSAIPLSANSVLLQAFLHEIALQNQESSEAIVFTD